MTPPVKVPMPAIAKLHDGGRAPNPRRVRIFFAEKNMLLPELVPVDIASLEQRQPEFLKLNPFGQIPLMVLEDGTALSETVAICRYIEALQPEPALFGRGALEQALVEMWNRRIEFGLYLAVQAVFRHSHPGMAGLEKPQVQEWAAVNRPIVERHLAILEAQLAGRSFICGDDITIADITAGVVIDLMKPAKITLDDGHSNIRRWHETMRARPSWSA